MIPDLRADGFLPAGVHQADSWDEFAARYGNNKWRLAMLRYLREGLENLRDAGCDWVLLDGSFVTDKAHPNDVDGCWNLAASIDFDALDSAFLLIEDGDRAALNDAYTMDFFPAAAFDGSGRPFSEFFQFTPEGAPKGIIKLELSAL